MEKQIAVLIDGDNISAKYSEYIKQEALQYGNVKIFRLYGSVNSKTVKAWYNVMPLQGIVPVLQISYANGKSIADQALTIDAMDLLYSNDVDVFCIVSSDSDFTKLVYRLKEAGKTVVGMGEKKTKEALAKACDEFKILDLIYKEANEVEDEETEEVQEVAAKSVEEVVQPSTIEEGTEEEEVEEVEVEEKEINIPPEKEIIDYILEYIDSYVDSAEEEVNLADIGRILKQKYLGFDARNYEHKNLTKMIKSHSDCFTVRSEKASDRIHSVIYIRRK
ncbi:MAG: NYN domain-containing protein [Lachnospiraceae bacterium]|nr:NYN domain-containing protein [Lachnospiraceae bacterium]